MSSEIFTDKFQVLVNRNSKSSFILKIFGILLMVFGVFATLLFNFQLQKQNSAIQHTLSNKTILVDSLIRSGNIVKSRRDTIVNLIYGLLRIKADTIDIARYYADTLERYYLLNNISLSEVKRLRNEYNRSHPIPQIDYNDQDISIDIVNKDTVIALINVLYTSHKQQEIIYELKFNSENKIFYIRNLLPRNR